jgi:signal transduction histidine kinase
MNIESPCMQELALRSSPDELLRQHETVSAVTTLTSVLETMPHIVMILNKHRQMVWANRHLPEALNNETVSELLGLRPGEAFNCINALKAEAGCGTATDCQVCAALHALQKSLAGQRGDEECLVMTAGGDTLNLRVTACRIEVEGEDFYSVSLIDISDEKNRRMLERLFFHDIMNIAGSVQGFLDLLPEQIQEDEQTLAETLSILAISAGDLIDLIKSQKDLLSAEHNELAVYPQPVDPRELLLNVQRFFQRNALFDKRGVEMQCDGDDGVFQCDDRILKRVLINAVKNALEAVREGESVRLRYKSQGQHALFEVSNDTVIPEEVQSRIFKKSFSTKSKDRGIGTYSIKLFTEKYLGGKVWFVSSKEHGTTFYIRVPKGS